MTDFIKYEIIWEQCAWFVGTLWMGGHIQTSIIMYMEIIKSIINYLEKT